MKYEKPSMELKWLEAREVFMTVSRVTEGEGDGGGFGDDNANDDGF